MKNVHVDMRSRRGQQNKFRKAEVKNLREVEYRGKKLRKVYNLLISLKTVRIMKANERISTRSRQGKQSKSKKAEIKPV